MSKKRSAEEADVEDLADLANDNQSNKRGNNTLASDGDDDDKSGDNQSPSASQDPSEEENLSQEKEGNRNNDNNNDNTQGGPTEQQEEKGQADDDDNNEEEEEEEETEKEPRERKSINKFGKPAEAGIIKTIHVENFMCHQKLKVDFCRNVNFINGQNGSGKSAILAAIQICLGAKAGRTHRARNIKDLVRKEAAGNNPNTSAKVRVTLLNEGGDGYKQELYGDSITIERTIALKGGYNGYKLYADNGKEISRNKRDLDDMLDHLNIQVENPVAILDQEEAKKFLKGKPSEKYQFFLKATELERIDAAYRRIKEERDNMDAKRERILEQMQNDVAKVQALKEKVDQFKAVNELEKKCWELEILYAWAFFGERDSEHQEKVDRLAAFQEKVQELQLKLSQAEEELSGASDRNEEQRIKERMKELEIEARSQAALKRQIEEKLKEALKPYKQCERDVKSNDKSVKQAEKEVKHAKDVLKKTRDEILAKSGSAESDEARRTQELGEIEAALVREEVKGPVLSEALTVAYQKYEEIGPESEQAQEMLNQQKKRVFAVERNLRDLQNSSANDSVAIFGQACSKMHKLVENAKRQGQFKGEVLGPIGKYIKIAPGKDAYAELAEGALGFNSLDRFIVTNSDDRKLCESFRSKIGCRKECSLFQVSPSTRFQVPNPPAKDIETVASVLSVSNDIVYNCLVDMFRIDQIALAPSREVSEECLLEALPNGRFKIKGVINRVTFLPHGDFWTVRDGSLSLSSNDRKSRERKIGVDRTRAIAEATDQYEALKAEMKEAEKVANEVGKREHELKQAWNKCNKEQKQNVNLVKELKQRKENLEVEMQTTATVTVDTTELEESVSQAQETLAECKEKEAHLKKLLEELQPNVNKAREEVDEVQSRNEKVLADMEAEEKKLSACLERQTQSEGKLQKRREKLEKVNTIVEEHEKAMAMTQDARDKALLQARKLELSNKIKLEQDEDNTGENPSPSATQDFSEEELESVEVRKVPKDSKYYEARINRQLDKIEKEKERRAVCNEDPAEVMEQYLLARTKLQKTRQFADDAEMHENALNKDLRDRDKRSKKMRAHLSKITDSKFDTILRLNNSCGSVEFDEDKGEMNMMVQKDLNDPSSQTNDVKALSGGERSFATISLLLALGESLETPFRVLDEFDVFLDTHARKLTIQTLIFVAKKMVNRQFIFITPQDLSSVTPDRMLKVFKLKPPERGAQQAGGATQQTLDFSQSQG